MTDAGELEARVSREMVAAMKAHDSERTGTLRLIKTALKNKSIDKRAPLTQAESEQTLASMIKQRRDSIEQFTKGNRPELAAKRPQRSSSLRSFCPRPSTNPRSPRWWRRPSPNWPRPPAKSPVPKRWALP